MILHGIEYQRPTSLNMRIMADHVTYSFLAFMKSIFHFCLGCYCGGYSQNGRSNLSSLSLVQIMAWHWPGEKLLSEPMMVRLLMHICITHMKDRYPGAFPVNLPWGECHRPTVMLSQHWFRWWLGAMELIEAINCCETNSTVTKPV